MIEILHISDLHFTKNDKVFRFIEPGPEGMADVVSASLRGHPAYVVLSGDFGWDGDAADFGLARRFIAKLAANLGIKQDRLVVVPGNHDIRWLRGGQPATNEDRDSPYRDFYELVRGQPPRADLGDIIVTSDLTLLALNSSLLESKGSAGYGFVGEKQLDDMWKEMQKVPQFAKAAPRVAVLHHHLLPVTWLEPHNTDNQYSLTLDAETIQQWLINHEFRVVLHGHQHQPFLRAISNPARQSQCTLLIAGAGSAGVVTDLLGDVKRNHFQVIRVDRKSVEIDWYLSDYQNPKEFGFDRTFSYPAKSAAGKPVSLFIGVSGGTSEERVAFTSTLVEALRTELGKTLPVNLVPSVAKELIDQGHGHDDQTSADDYAAYIRRHIRNVNDASKPGVVVFDRTLLDTLAFAELNRNLHNDWLTLAVEAARAIAERMNLYFYIPPVGSDPRNSSDRSYQQRADDAIWTVLQRLKPDFITLSREQDQGVARAVKIAMEKLAEMGW